MVFKRILYFILAESIFIYLSNVIELGLLPIILGCCFIFSYMKIKQEMDIIKIIILSILVSFLSFAFMILLNEMIERIFSSSLTKFIEILLVMLCCGIVIYLLELVIKFSYKRLFGKRNINGKLQQ
ncbi:DUF4029 domain-containing protein [Bacillus wiedmannii]|uniref:DUF4029 domain-containing protein n=1 Tax=Bacillus wiedmannii TaxID=1890302 RepID=UPI003D98CED5